MKKNKMMKKPEVINKVSSIIFFIFCLLINEISSQSLPLVYYHPRGQGQWQQQPPSQQESRWPVKYHYRDPSTQNYNYPNYRPNYQNFDQNRQNSQPKDGRTDFFNNQIPMGPPSFNTNNMIPNFNGYKDFPGHNFWPGSGVLSDPKIPGHHFMPENKNLGGNFGPNFDNNFVNFAPNMGNFDKNLGNFGGNFPAGHNFYHEDNACDLPLEVGTCNGYYRRYFYDKSDKICKEFVFKECGGNGNNFENPEVCKLTCAAKEVQTMKREEKESNFTCNLQVSSGLCFSNYKRFAFDAKDKICKEFFYSGCEGNSNNFYNPNDCLEHCQGSGIKYINGPPKDSNEPKDGHNDKHGDHLDPKMSEEVCKLPLDKGTPSCEGHDRPKLRFFCNESAKICQEFLFTGCEGNLNNFIHGDNCKRYCSATAIVYLGGQRSDNQPIPIHPDCLMGVTKGYCSGSYVAYFFNPSTRTCQAYVYTGCGNSVNHFASPNDCVMRCPAINVNTIPMYV